MNICFTIENYNKYCELVGIKNTNPDSLRSFRKFLGI